jgi:hypothetical protein
MSMGQLLKHPFPPETGEKCRWRLFPATSLGQNAAACKIDLKKVIGGDDRAAYMGNRVWSEKNRWVNLEVGSDDSVLIWLNGQEVHRFEGGRGVVPGSDKLQVHLRAGWNDLLAKVTQASQGWGYCARIAERPGETISDLRIMPGYAPLIDITPDPPSSGGRE